MCLSLNTSGRSGIQVTWTAADQTAGTGTRSMGLALQYRVGASGTFTTVSSTTYTSSGSAQSAAQTFSAITLPSACDNQSVVHLRWIYYEIGTTGSRDAISLDEISVSSSALITSAQSGPWNSTTTWVGGVVPTSSQSVIIAASHTVTVDAAVTRNAGTTTTINSTGTLATGFTYTNNGTTTVNGTFQLNSGGWANGSNNFTYGSSPASWLSTAARHMASAIPMFSGPRAAVPPTYRYSRAALR
jgi:hypothetical protein